MVDESGGRRDSTHPVRDAEAEGEAGAESRDAVEPRRPRSAFDDDQQPPPPPRPSLSDERKPPVLRKIPAPRPVKVGRALWLISFVLGGAAVFIAFLSGDTLMAELTDVLGRLAPGYSDEEVAALVDVIFWSSLGGLGLIIAIEAILLAMIMNQRGGARWLQLPLLILHAGAVFVGSAFLAIGDWGALIEILLVAGVVVAFAGWVLTLLPRAHRWFRMKDQTEPVPLD
jgi:hypothetical protein